VKRREDEDEQAPYVFCERCEQMFERSQIRECPYCEKRFCPSCAVRSGSQAFCGKACAKNWFFSDSEEESAEAEERGEIEKGEP
jgi:hypothetical protein